MALVGGILVGQLVRRVIATSCFLNGTLFLLPFHPYCLHLGKMLRTSPNEQKCMLIGTEGGWFKQKLQKFFFKDRNMINNRVIHYKHFGQ